MILINKANIAKHAMMRGHAAQALGQRYQFNTFQANLDRDHGAGSAGVWVNDMAQEPHRRIATNSLEGEYWAELDKQANQIAAETMGREIFTDLQSLVTVLPVGKTVRGYTKIGDISDHVTISMDGQTPQTFDRAGESYDADPIPFFTAGYGINFREWQGLLSANIDLMLSSQRAKLEKLLNEAASYALTGNAKIQEAGYPGQGLKNHRNTKKINLGASGENIDLTTASAADTIAFFSQTFGAALDANAVAAVDVLWVSPQIRARLALPYAATRGILAGSTEANLLAFSGRIREIRTDYSLSGNEFLAYVRSKAYLEIPTGQALAIVPMPRLTPRANFNNDISTAFGVSVRVDGKGRGGVFYGAAVS